MDKLKKLATVDSSDTIERLERAIARQEKQIARINRVFSAAIIACMAIAIVILPIINKM